MAIKTVALDAMGGDHGYPVIIPAALQVLKHHPNVKIFLVGQQEKLESFLRTQGPIPSDRLEIINASEVVEMDELPSQALRTKKDSSMRVAINLVKEGRAQACVSAGNTGALMAIARFVLKTLPGIDRPAIISSFPTTDNAEVRVLDLGANIDVTPENLYQFAVMGSVLSSAADNIPNPRIGLLNVGSEEIKGNELVKKTHELLEQSTDLHYIGYVEGDAMFEHVADVVVCDGFVGNITLKSCEGISKLIMKYIKEAFQASWWTKLIAVLALPILKRLRKQLDPSQYNGATLLGLDGIVIKSHGGANVLGFRCAIEEALLEIDNNIPHLLKEKVQHILSK